MAKIFFQMNLCGTTGSLKNQHYKQYKYTKKTTAFGQKWAKMSSIFINYGNDKQSKQDLQSKPGSTKALVGFQITDLKIEQTL